MLQPAFDGDDVRRDELWLRVMVGGTIDSLNFAEDVPFLVDQFD